MNTKITLRFQALRMISIVGWTALLVLSIFIRGLLSETIFWVLAITIIILFIVDIILLIIRVIEGHYLIITEREIIQKRLFKPKKSILISNIKSLKHTYTKYGGEYVTISDDESTIILKLEYKVSKEDILLYIQDSSNFPKNLDLVKEGHKV